MRLFIPILSLLFCVNSTPSSSPPHKCQHVDAAQNVLRRSWSEDLGYTIPCGIATNDACKSGTLSTWSSTFTSAANARFNASRAKVEFNNLMSGQWKNGFLPHVTYLTKVNRPINTTSTNNNQAILSHNYNSYNNEKNYNNHSNHSNIPTYHSVGNWTGLTPGPEWWGISIKNKNGRFKTSGVAAPPTQATAALQIYLYLWHEHPSGTTAHEFLYQAFVNVYNWHAYLHTQRDPDGNGLVFIRHPWESPLSWNASSVASALSRSTIRSIPPKNLTLFPSSLLHLPGFPGNETYKKMLGIAACQSQLNWDDKKISNISSIDLSSPCGFLVEDIAFNSLLLRADHDLYTISVLLLQDKQEPEFDSSIVEMQLQIQQWISLMESSKALGSKTIVRQLPTSDVAAGAVMISKDLSHPNASAKDHFDVGSLFPLMTADRISTNLANELSTTALSPLFWSRYPLSISSLLSFSEENDNKADKDKDKDKHKEKDKAKDKAHNNDITTSLFQQPKAKNCPKEKDEAYLSEIPIAIHVTGLLVEAWAMDISGEQGLTLKVLANFMSSQARTLFPGCPLSNPPKPFYDFYGSDTGRPLPGTAEFGVVISSPRAAAVAIILSNLTLPNAPPIPPVGLGMTLVIVWVELTFAFAVGISCILLAVYHIRLISKQDKAEEDARANAYRQREESSYRGDSDVYGTESGDEGSRNNDFGENDLLDYADNGPDSMESPSRLRHSTISSESKNGGAEWSWPLSYLFGEGGGEESQRHTKKRTEYQTNQRYTNDSPADALLPSESESDESMNGTDFDA